MLIKFDFPLSNILEIAHFLSWATDKVYFHDAETTWEQFLHHCHAVKIIHQSDGFSTQRANNAYWAQLGLSTNAYIILYRYRQVSNIRRTLVSN